MSQVVNNSEIETLQPTLQRGEAVSAVDSQPRSHRSFSLEEALTLSATGLPTADVVLEPDVEELLPGYAKLAFSAARKSVLLSGLPAIASRENTLYKAYASGHSELLKALPPSTRLTPGTRLKLGPR